MRRASRIERAHARAGAAKTAVGALALLVFGAAFAGAKAYAPGHPKGKARPLGAPASFERKLHRGVVQGGKIAPAVQPPSVASSSS